MRPRNNKQPNKNDRSTQRRTATTHNKTHDTRGTDHQNPRAIGRRTTRAHPRTTQQRAREHKPALTGRRLQTPHTPHGYHTAARWQSIELAHLSRSLGPRGKRTHTAHTQQQIPLLCSIGQGTCLHVNTILIELLKFASPQFGALPAVCARRYSKYDVYLKFPSDCGQVQYFPHNDDI